MTKAEFLDYLHQHCERELDFLQIAEAGRFSRTDLESYVWAFDKDRTIQVINNIQHWPDEFFTSAMISTYEIIRDKDGSLVYRLIPALNFFATFLGMTEDGLRRMVEAN